MNGMAMGHQGVRAMARLRQLVRQRTGICLPAEEGDHGKFQGVIERCLAHTDCRSPDDYMRLLEQLPGDSGEWERLIGELTVNETYFFRDRGQFKLLRYVVLPKLIEGR
ncbi:MAG: hypothetical protein B0D96_00090, partial [Candidatus Sedimenticola endophacoides]